MNPLAILLAISLIANAALGWSYLGQRDKAVSETVKTEQATGAAVACSAGVDGLQQQATTRHAEAAPKVDAAKRASVAANIKADVILAAAATTPGDDCKSASDRVETWWADRGKP